RAEEDERRAAGTLPQLRARRLLLVVACRVLIVALAVVVSYRRSSDRAPGPRKGRRRSLRTDLRARSPSSNVGSASYLGDWSSGDYPPNFNGGDARIHWA